MIDEVDHVCLTYSHSALDKHTYMDMFTYVHMQTHVHAHLLSQFLEAFFIIILLIIVFILTVTTYSDGNTHTLTHTPCSE